MEKVFTENTSVKRIGNFMWSGIESESPIRIKQLGDRYARVALQLVEYPEIAKFYSYESERMRSIYAVYTKYGIFPTRADLSDLPIEGSAHLQALEM